MVVKLLAETSAFRHFIINFWASKRIFLRRPMRKARHNLVFTCIRNSECYRERKSVEKVQVVQHVYNLIKISLQDYKLYNIDYHKHVFYLRTPQKEPPHEMDEAGRRA